MDELNTGDLVLFHGEGNIYSEGIEFVTHSDWSHCAMVVRNPRFTCPPLKGLYIWESGQENTLNPETNRKNIGVQFTSLVEKMQTYEGTAAYRKLLGPLPSQEQLSNIHHIVHAKPYNYWIPDYLSIILKKLWKPKPTDRYYWCSSLVARVWQACGVIPEETDWNAITPADLAGSVECKSPYLLGPVTRLVNKYNT